MKKILEIFLGILTAMGGFVEIGELVFSVDAGAKFRYSLLWVVALGTIGIITYGEMSGRIAAVAQQPVFFLIRQRAGYAAGLGTLVAALAVSVLTCAAEIGGVALILKLLFGGNYFLLIVVALIFFLLVVWFLSFQAIERVFGLLGLLMLVFVIAAAYLENDWGQVAAGFIPSVPAVDTSKDYFVYAYFVVALMSSIMLPYETYFYAALLRRGCAGGRLESGGHNSEQDHRDNRIFAGCSPRRRSFAYGSIISRTADDRASTAGNGRSRPIDDLWKVGPRNRVAGNVLRVRRCGDRERTFGCLQPFAIFRLDMGEISNAEGRTAFSSELDRDLYRGRDHRAHRC